MEIRKSTEDKIFDGKVRDKMVKKHNNKRKHRKRCGCQKRKINWGKVW